MKLEASLESGTFTCVPGHWIAARHERHESRPRIKFTGISKLVCPTFRPLLSCGHEGGALYLDEGAVEVDALDGQELGEGLRLTLLHLHHTKDTCARRPQ